MSLLCDSRRVLRPSGLLVVTVPSRIAPHLVYSFLDQVVAPLYRGIRGLVTGSVRRGHIPDHPRHPLAPLATRRHPLLAEDSGNRRWAFSHFCVYLLDRFFPDLSRRIDRRCTALEESPLPGSLGTQHIVAAVKCGEISPEAG